MPVKQYEPFFDDTHEYQYGQSVGVASTLFYDPMGRVVATLHPNHTYEKVVFDPWRQETWDANDTTPDPSDPAHYQPDPADDTDVGACFRRIDRADYLPTWYELRTDTSNAEKEWSDKARRDAESDAAKKASIHRSTPTTAYMDSLRQDVP